MESTKKPSHDNDALDTHLFSAQPSQPFRPKRRSPSSMFRGALITAKINGKDSSVRELSMAGGGFRGRFKIQPGEVVAIDIFANEKSIYSGKGTVAWSEFDSIGSDFGVQFVDWFDSEKIEREVQRLVARAVAKEDHSTLYDALPEAYKVLSSELSHHLASLRSKAEALEPEGEKFDQTKRAASTKRLLQECGPQFADIWYRFNDVVLSIPRSNPQFKAMKWHTENVIRPLFMGAPVWKRSWDKPLGYPGDYRIMLYAYDSLDFVMTPTLYDSVVHGYLAHTLGACIRGRMMRTLDHINARIDEVEGSSDEPIEMLNLGCGAARELPILLADKQKIGGKHINIHLVEQDAEALQHAIEISYPSVSQFQERVNVRGLNVSFKDVLRAGNLASEYGPQDVIYSLGLIDYFPLSTGKRMARDLYARLKPGGILTWCNVATTRETCYWPLEFITDWTLYYRNEAEMREMFDLPGAEITLELEESKQIWVISAKKPL